MSVSPVYPVAGWAAPSAPRIVNAPGNASVTNPLQAWVTLVESILTLQRRTLANVAAAAGTGRIGNR